MVFLDDSVTWSYVHVAVALALGFRPKTNMDGAAMLLKVNAKGGSEESSVEWMKDPSLAPIGWESVRHVPDFAPLPLEIGITRQSSDVNKESSDCVEQRLTRDLPEEEKAMGK
jgi:hypothetical protein